LRDSWFEYRFMGDGPGVCDEPVGMPVVCGKGFLVGVFRGEEEMN
jgi:hypothetical protein